MYLTVQCFTTDSNRKEDSCEAKYNYNSVSANTKSDKRIEIRKQIKQPNQSKRDYSLRIRLKIKRKIVIDSTEICYKCNKRPKY